MERLSAWLLTETGKKAVYISACIGSISTFLMKCLPNTFLLEQYKDLLHFYEHGMPKPLSDDLKNRFTKALDLLEVPEKDRHLFKPFLSIGWDCFSAGTAYSRFGVIIGIPFLFEYKRVEDVETRKIRINQESVPWGVPEADLYLKTLILSENAQLYGIAREIKMSQTPKLYLECLYASLPVLQYYGISNYFNTKFNLYVRHIALRLVLYSLAGTFAIGQYVLLKDLTQTYFEKKVDEELKQKNRIFIEGGRETYGKLIARNVAMRELMGNVGKKYYTALGNEKSLIRQKHIPLSERRLFFENALKEQNA